MSHAVAVPIPISVTRYASTLADSGCTDPIRLGQSSFSLAPLRDPEAIGLYELGDSVVVTLDGSSTP